MTKGEKVAQISNNLFNLVSNNNIVTSREMSKEQKNELYKLLKDDATYLGEQTRSKKNSGGEISAVKVASAAKPEDAITIVLLLDNYVTVLPISKLTPEIKKIFCKTFFDASRTRA